MTSKIFPIVAMAYSTIDLEEPGLVEYFASSLKDLFDESDLIVSYLPFKSNTPMQSLLSDIRTIELLSVAKEHHKNWYGGVIVFSDINGTKFHAAYEWKKYFKRAWSKVIETNSREQNIVSFSFDADLINGRNKRDRLVHFSRYVSSNFHSNYFRIFHGKNDRAKIIGNNDLSGGLNDIYWLNIFGKPFIEIIGRDKLMRSPAYQVIEIENSNILLQVSEPFCDHKSSECSHVLQNIRGHIGEDYFYSSGDIEIEKSGSSSFIEFIKYHYKQKKLLKNEKRKAQFCPDFDWRGMIVN